MSESYVVCHRFIISWSEIFCKLKYYNIKLILDRHENFKQYISENIDGAIFNLGYLPGGDKNITTKTNSTLKCLEDALECLNVHGVVVVVIYVGHHEGAIEGKGIFEFSKKN